MSAHPCPAWLIGAAGSHHGKTTVTAALARHHRDRGRVVRVFKAGPDFLDPMILERASGHSVYTLDLWMAGEAECGRLLYQAAAEADLILVEGVMGLYDGIPSSADLAQRFGIPIVAVINATGVAQTLGAIAYGLAKSRANVPFAGVLANAVASARHGEMIEQGIPPDIKYLGGVSRDVRFALPERHLGLVQAQEVMDLDERMRAGAAAISSTALTELPSPVEFTVPPEAAVPPLLAGVHIGVARDAAFSFVYPANLDLLRRLGATLCFFSPLTDRALPPVDGLYLPGGYPELHLGALERNAAMKTAIAQHHRAGKPIYAECGGMLYLLQALTNKGGASGRMVGLLPGTARLQARLQGLGYQSAPLPPGPLRAHTFHHSVIETSLTPVAHGQRLHDTSPGEAIYQVGRLTATYLHCYFPSNPSAAARLFQP